MNEEESSTSSVGGSDPLVFFVVNAFVFVLLCASCSYYCWCFQGTGSGRPGATESDRIYQDTILRRQQEALERKRESPQVRQDKIEQAIRRYGVRMVVQKGDLADEIATRAAEETLITIEKQTTFGSVGSETTSTSTCSSDDDPVVRGNDCNSSLVKPFDSSDVFRETIGAGSPLEVHLPAEELTPAAVCSQDYENNRKEIVDVEMGVPESADEQQVDQTFEVTDDTPVEECESGYLMLPCLRQVPNCCAICLCPYEVAETVIWSNNRVCNHAFHEECISEWLLKLHEGTSCPCCRQEFLPNVTSEAAKQRPVTWAPGAFNTSAISFR